MKKIAIFLILAVLAACSRPLTDNEIAFLGGSTGGSIDYGEVRIREGGFPLLLDAEAVTVKNKIYWSKETYSDDFTKSIYINDIALLSHEIVHVWQFQNRSQTGYTLAKIIAEHKKYGDNVYKYPKPLESDRSFLSYRYEQQGKIVEDWIIKSATSSPDAPIYEKVIRSALPLSLFDGVRVRLRPE